MINKIKHSISFVLIVSISNLPLIGTTFASEPKSLKGDSAKSSTPIFFNDGIEDLTINSGSFFVRSDLLFQNQKYRNINEKYSKQSPFIISGRIPKGVENLGEELKILFKTLNSDNEQEVSRMLSKYPIKSPSSYQIRRIRYQIAKKLGYETVGYGTVVSLSSGGIFVCIKSQCLVKSKNEN
ncbi:MAG: hypothetical protein WCO29_22560 [Nostocales cyanobacterium ELA583]|jgi:hypothetical protein